MKCPTIQELPSPPSGKTGWPWTEGSLAGPLVRMKSGLCPKISIVTPSYNQGRFIEETIRSVLLQGYPNLEYVIMDGGSTDDTVEIIRKYEPWLTHWTSEKDHGQSHAINKGWSLAKGEIVAWINSDDTYAAGSFEKVAEYFLTQPSVAMVYGDCNIIDEKGSFAKSCPTTEFNLKDLVSNKWFIPQQATFIRRNALDAVGGIREDLHLVMDWEFWLRIALNGYSIQYLPVPLACFRTWGEAKTSSQSERSAQEKISVLDDYFSTERVLPEINSFRRGAYGNVHRFAGTVYYRKGRRLNALIHMLKAIWYCPSLVKEKKVLKMIMIILIGKTLNEKRRDLYYWFLKGMRQSK
jgi:glycosyltransferase involved in cell wall biosynthesis